jgi:thiamine-monophosphate kinase
VLLNENDIIHQLTLASPGWIGDDAAILPHSKYRMVITKDLLIEDVHFKTRYVTPQQLAYKALQVNLSDLAAMGAYPAYILCGIAIPMHHADYAQCFLTELPLMCRQDNIILIGGDTVRSDNKLCLSITAIGYVHHAMAHRHTAKVSDRMAVVGHLGKAHVGWQLLEQSLPHVKDDTHAFLYPKAKLKEGQWLASYVTSMMDISDGLYVDAQRLCQASGVAGILDISPSLLKGDFIALCKRLRLNPMSVALSGGEDYGLLCTIPEASFNHVSNEFLKIFDEPIIPVGRITHGSGVSCNVPIAPFTHFGESMA